MTTSVKAVFNFIVGSDLSEVLYGTISSDQIYGQYGNDQIYAVAGNDAVYGGFGNDVLNGGSGNDVISGDAGDDKLTGGTGSDRFFFRSGYDMIGGKSYSLAGNDVVTDFTHGVDRLDFRNVGGYHQNISDLEDVKALSHQEKGNLVIDVFGGHITLEHVKFADLSASDFLF